MCWDTTTGRRYAEAMEAFMRLPALDPVQRAFVAACCAWSGDETAAQAHVARLREAAPELDLAGVMQTTHYANDSSDSPYLSYHIGDMFTVSHCNDEPHMRVTFVAFAEFDFLDVRAFVGDSTMTRRLGVAGLKGRSSGNAPTL